MHLQLVVVGTVEGDGEVVGNVVDILVLVLLAIIGVGDIAGGLLPGLGYLRELLGEVGDGGIRGRRNFLAVHVIVELHVLDCAVDVLVDVVVEQVLVEAHEEDELAHRGDESAVALEDEGAVGGAEFLEVADHSERIEDSGDTDKTADEVSEGCLGDDIHAGFLERCTVVGDTVFLIPRVLAPLGVLGRSGRHDLGEGLVVTVGVARLVAAGHLADVALAVGQDHVKETADGDFPSLCGGVLGSVDVEGPRSVLVVVLVAFVAVIVAAGLADRDEVDVGPGGSLLDEVLALGLDGTDGSSPDVETLHELLGEVHEADA